MTAILPSGYRTDPALAHFLTVGQTAAEGGFLPVVPEHTYWLQGRHASGRESGVGFSPARIGRHRRV